MLSREECNKRVAEAIDQYEKRFILEQLQKMTKELIAENENKFNNINNK